MSIRRIIQTLFSTKFAVTQLPTDTGMSSIALNREFRRLGVASICITDTPSGLYHGSDITFSRKGNRRLHYELERVAALLYIFRTQAVLFNFGRTLFAPTPAPAQCGRARLILHFAYNIYLQVMQRFELGVLSFRGCTLAVQYQGDDARQGDALRLLYTYSHVNYVEEGYYTRGSDELKRRQIALLDRYCQRLYALNPDLLNVLPGRTQFIPYSHIELPQLAYAAHEEVRQTVRVGHAPTHQRQKGTSFLIAAIKRLQGQGVRVELELIEGVSHEQATDRIRRVDVFVDQLLGGWYGGVAVEAMSFGIPVISYIRHEDLRFIPKRMHSELPIISASVHDIADQILRFYLLDAKARSLLRQQSRDYVERWHNPEKTALRILEELLSESPIRLDLKSI